MTEFLSEENLALHREYLRTCSLKYSILEKSIRGISRKQVTEILGMRLPRAQRNDVLALLPEIELHELYFKSFCDIKNVRSSLVCERFVSEAGFLNYLYRLGMGLDHGFVTVNVKGDKIECMATDDYASCYTTGIPVLAIDLCEHAYFYDYGFDKSGYLINALPYIDLTRIDEFFV